MHPMICIDFGNSFTKVGIRSNRTSASSLAADASLTLDGGNFCVPTVAASWRRAGKTTWHFGSNTIVLRGVARADYRTFRNWKPFFFEGSESRIRDAVPAPALAPALANGRSSQSISDDKWNQAKAMFGLTDDKRAAFETLTSGPQVSDESLKIAKPEETDIDYKEIGLGFFRWLREFIRPICTKRGLGPIEEIPTRISLPSFGTGATKAELLLREILEEAGWRLDEAVPALAEPLANTIGIFTEGINAIHRPNRQRNETPNYGVMFYNTGLLHAMREATLANGPKSSWVLVADLGGYTFDLAMIGLDLQDLDGRIDGAIDGMRRFAMHSEPIGVAMLDRRVKAVLDPAKRTVFEEIESDPDQLRLESIHKIVYGRGRGARFRGVTFGDGGEGPRMKHCFENFATELADCAQKFLEIHQYERIDDLIVTGGGGMIPFVRNALRKRLEGPYGIRKFHFFGDNQPGQQLHSLNENFVRGATALGGASVYFDFAE